MMMMKLAYLFSLATLFVPTVTAVEFLALGKIPVLSNLLCGCWLPECATTIVGGNSCSCSNGIFALADQCNYEVCCAARRLRRSLMSDSSLQVSELDDILLESCGKYDYEIAIFAEEDDVYAIASPTEEAVNANCPMLVADNGDLNKEVSVWNSKEDGMVHFQNSFTLGAYKLSEILTAYQKVDKVSNHRDYLGPMAEELNLKVTSEFSSHLAQKKWQADSYVHGMDQTTIESAIRLEYCGEADYELSLYVDSHMYVVATPKDGIDCPLLASHAVFGHEETSKQMLVWNGKKEVTAFDTALPVGSFKLNEYVGAYKQATPGSGSYEVVSNNCGDFVANMGVALGVTPTDEMSTYIVRNLMEQTTDEFKEKIRNSDNYKNLLQDENDRQLRSNPQDKEIMKRLVESRM